MAVRLVTATEPICADSPGLIPYHPSGGLTLDYRFGYRRRSVERQNYLDKYYFAVNPDHPSRSRAAQST